jgi:dienelactone hydrolase
MRPLHLIIMGLALAAPAAAQMQSPALTATTTGQIVFDAPTYAHFGAFRSGESRPEKAAATIHLPADDRLARDGKLPAVVIGHSIGGWKDSSEGLYVQHLLGAGFAVLGLDHFGPRNIARAADVPGAFSPITSTSDGLLALKLAATHPRIDAARIGVMGLSMGGMTAELSAYEFTRRKVLGENSPLKFAAHLTLYAPCGYILSSASGPMTTGAPMLQLFAGKDETTPRAKCERIAALLRAAEPQLPRRAIWYEDAYHAWELPFAPKFFPHHVNQGKCPVIDFGARMRFIDAGGGERPFSGAELQACIRDSAGYSMGRSEAAMQDAAKQTLAFFGEHLK